MKTTIDIPEDVLKEAIENSHAVTKREAVLAALEEYNRRHRLNKARALLGTFENMITSEQLRELRNSRSARNGLT